jgi:hypothetical protein
MSASVMAAKIRARKALDRARGDSGQSDKRQVSHRRHVPIVFSRQ